MYTGQMEMPEYLCNERVWALQIDSIFKKRNSKEYKILAVNTSYGGIDIDQDYIDKHKPHAGGYYIVNKTGYKSFLPYETFVKLFVRHGFRGNDELITTGQSW